MTTLLGIIAVVTGIYTLVTHSIGYNYSIALIFLGSAMTLVGLSVRANKKYNRRGLYY